MSTANRRLRWGILGVAKINNRLKPAFHASQTVKLQAIASRSLEKAQAAATDFGIETAHGSYEALLADPNVDAVYIPLPNSMHGEWTRKAADAGKHILCEKPLCPDAKEAAELVAYCRSKNVRLMDGFMWPHHPRTHAIRKILDEGTIGDVQRVTSAFTFQMESLDLNNIRLQPGLGGGSLLDVGCYPVYGIRWAFGCEPTLAFARAKLVNGVDVELSAQLTFADGRMASFDCGFTLPYRAWLEITGTKGVVRIPNLWAPKSHASYEVELNGESAKPHLIEGEDHMVHMLDDFAHAVWEQREPVPSPDEAVKTLRVLDAITKSVAEGREVKVGE
ncbi:Gfo/Idh/MocA family protein [Zavarzinella formosa]|uniref:Gfo/Idh/MocA family protein n=1 Tax=Zavarzinella formosa TaxID=360055 RepID=UPI0002F856E8|nr:Gfo/Idh/MocA family oxidoreductase [Zavarzinella formosa]